MRFEVFDWNKRGIIMNTSNKMTGYSNILCECKDIRKSITVKGREIRVLKGLNLSVNRGEIVVIVGKTGTGKSTFLRLLAGLERQTSGSIIFEGRCMETLSNEELTLLRRRKIGIVFQSFNLLPSWTAFENVEAALLHIGMSKTTRYEKVKMLLNGLGADDWFDNLPLELSMGQQQCMAIARALANEPSLILADEPTGEIDTEGAQKIIGHLISPVREKGVTLIIVTHGIFPIDIADRVFYLKDGTLVTQ